MRALICDRCGYVIRGKECESAKKLTLSTEITGAFYTRHLCEECLTAFGFFMEEGRDSEDHTKKHSGTN